MLRHHAPHGRGSGTHLALHLEQWATHHGRTLDLLLILVGAALGWVLYSSAASHWH